MSNHRAVSLAVMAETPRSVEVIEVVKVTAIRGDGINSPVRLVTQYWSEGGSLLAEDDPCRDHPAPCEAVSPADD